MPIWSAIRKLALSSVVPLDSRKRMDELAAERYAQKLSIRYVSGPRNKIFQSSTARGFHGGVPRNYISPSSHAPASGHENAPATCCTSLLRPVVEYRVACCWRGATWRKTGFAAASPKNNCSGGQHAQSGRDKVYPESVPVAYPRLTLAHRHQMMTLGR
jgi:hypothetical protein